MSYYPASEFQDIDLLISPLTRLRKVSRRLASKAPDATQHWAIKVADFCYELKREGLRGSLYRDWKYENPGYFAPIKIGVTRESWSRLVVIVVKIWFGRFEQAYRFSTSNCQNFCYCFYKAICVDANDPDITDEEYDTWQLFPKNLTEITKSFQKVAGVCFLGAAALSRCGMIPVYISAPAVIGTEVVSSFLSKKTTKDKRYLGLSSIPSEKQELEAYKDLLHTHIRAIRRIRDPDSAQEKTKRNAKQALEIIEAFEDAYNRDEAGDSAGYKSGYYSESGPEDEHLPRNIRKKRITNTNYGARRASYDSVRASGFEYRSLSRLSQQEARNGSGCRHMSSTPVREEEAAFDDPNSTALAPYTSSRAHAASDWSDWTWNEKPQQWSSYRFVNGEYEYEYREARDLS